MEKAKYMFRVDDEKLKFMKVWAVNEGQPLNVILEQAFDMYVTEKMKESKHFAILRDKEE